MLHLQLFIRRLDRLFYLKLLFLTLGILFCNTPIFAGLFNHTAKLRHVYLTWQNDPCRTITVNVQGIKTPTELTIYYDTKPHFSKLAHYRYKTTGKGTSPISLHDGRKLYHIELTQLKPNTTYYLTVGDRFRAYGNEVAFRTIPEEGPLFFVEGGDWENTPEAELLAKKAATLNPMAALLGGDYPSLVFGLKDYDKWDYWLDVYTRNMISDEGLLIPMVMAIGNHEVIGGFGQKREQAPFFFHYFSQGNTNASYFSLSFGKQMRLFVLDSGHTAAYDGEQLTWLKTALEEASDVPVTLAMYHVPLFPSVRFAEKDLLYRSVYGIVELCRDRHCAKKLFSEQSRLGRKYWLPLFDLYELTTAFEHHDQALKRTKCLRNGREDEGGTLFLGDGGWGAAIQYPPIQGYFYRHFSSLQGKVHFFWTVSISDDTITYQAMTATGRVLDQYVQPIKK